MYRLHSISNLSSTDHSSSSLERVNGQFCSSWDLVCFVLIVIVVVEQARETGGVGEGKEGGQEGRTFSTE